MESQKDCQLCFLVSCRFGFSYRPLRSGWEETTVQFEIGYDDDGGYDYCVIELVSILRLFAVHLVRRARHLRFSLLLLPGSIVQFHLAIRLAFEPLLGLQDGNPPEEVADVVVL